MCCSFWQQSFVTRTTIKKVGALCGFVVLGCHFFLGVDSELLHFSLWIAPFLLENLVRLWVSDCALTAYLHGLFDLYILWSRSWKPMDGISVDVSLSTSFWSVEPSRWLSKSGNLGLEYRPQVRMGVPRLVLPIFQNETLSAHFKGVTFGLTWEIGNGYILRTKSLSALTALTANFSYIIECRLQELGDAFRREEIHFISCVYGDQFFLTRLFFLPW